MGALDLPAWWPTPLREAIVYAETAGATGTARSMVTGLLELADEPVIMQEATKILTTMLPSDAPTWHIVKATRSANPADALHKIMNDLDSAVPKSIDAATRWVADHGSRVIAAPSSSIVAEVLARHGEQAGPQDPLVGLAGADAIGSTDVLNIRGTYELAQRVPTLVVTTSLKLVPDSVFYRIEEPIFERIPLSAFAGVVLDGEILDPVLAGRRAAALTE